MAAQEQISASFFALVAPSHPNDWEVEEIADNLAELPDHLCRGLLESVPAIWPVSHALCYSFLNYGSRQIGRIGLELLPDWTRQVLFHYEKEGLRAAEAFMADVSSSFLEKRTSVSGIGLDQVAPGMTHYIRGVAGRFLKLSGDKTVWTDTETIYLPHYLDVFPSEDRNRLLYKFLISYQWALIDLDIFTLFFSNGPSGERDHSVSSGDLIALSAASEDASAALRFYLFLQGCRYISLHFPGLWKRTAPLVLDVVNNREDPLGQALKTLFRSIEDALSSFAVSVGPVEIKSAELFINSWEDKHLRIISELDHFLLGELQFAKACRLIDERREQDRKAFITMLARILPESFVNGKEPEDTERGRDREGEAGIVVLSESIKKLASSKKQKTLRIDNSHVSVPDELRQLAERILSDLGTIPHGYIQAASGIAGQGLITGVPLDSPDDRQAAVSQEGYVYDEWDCRRSGYRKDWCTVREEELVITRSNFIHRTLEKYSGLRKRLRAQFELMQTAERFVRRQRDGDDLDLDAIIDAMGDRRAGKSVSDRLFVRLLRDQRSITTLFLIDMSNSTAGWVGTLIKESLVLLCEAMEVIGDRYGIYGFSGMKRSGCKLYHVKEPDESYDAAIWDRIAAIGPKDYTRMAPAIRHLTELLKKADTKTRLLIIFSDGKPEDYDGYYGEYAIEDTRKALLEARGVGITPFCITIDKQAHAYLEHMFGAGSYLFVNQLESLPAKMAQIYRVLTR